MTCKFPRILLLLIAALVATAFTVSCSSDDNEPTPVPSPPPPPVKVGRAVLVYMLADNNLSGNDYLNLSDMAAAAAEGALQGNRLIVYHDDRNAAAPSLKEVTAEGIKIIRKYDVTGFSTDPVRLSAVIKDFKEAAPADAFGFVFWSHAFGWQMANTPADTDVRPQWLGDDCGRHMDVDRFAAVMQGQGFDYVYFDCCHMASVESLYEMRHIAPAFVASCAEMPAAGSPYRKILRHLMADTPDLVAAAKATFDHYDAMTGNARTSTMSVIDAAGLERLAAVTRDIFSLHPRLPQQYSPQNYERVVELADGVRRLFDFGDYMDALCAGDPTLEASLARWHEALDGCVRWKAATPAIFNSLVIRKHCGLSTFIMRQPSDAGVSGYNRLKWYSDVAGTLYPSE